MAGVTDLAGTSGAQRRGRRQRHRPLARRVRDMVVASVIASTAFSVPASAAPQDAQLRAAREQFAAAEKDEDAGRWANALEKLRAVALVKSTAGVRYHIALCEEHIGRLAKALEDYAAAASQARDDNARDVLRLVGKQVTALEPRVPRLTVHLVPDNPDTSVTIDGEALERSRVGQAVPTDPGAHHVEATTTDRPPSATDVTLREGESVAIDLQLADAPPAAPLASAAPAPVSPLPAVAPFATPPRRRPVAAALTTTLGALLLAGGGVAALWLAGAAHDDGVRGCSTDVSRGADACDGYVRTVRAWDFAAAAAWASALAVGTVAVVLWTKTARAGSPPTQGRVMMGPRGLVIQGGF